MAGLFAFTELTPHQRTKVYRNNHFDAFTEYDDEKFLREFRMVKTEVKDLCGLLKDDLVCRGARKCDLTVEQKVLISLITLGSGSFQNTAKDFFGVSQPVVRSYHSLLMLWFKCRKNSFICHVIKMKRML